MINKLTQIFLRSTIEKYINEIKKDPVTGIKNLSGLSDLLSGSGVSESTLRKLEVALQDENSAHFKLVKRMATDCDKDYLVNFGVNIGCNVLSIGLKRIQTSCKKDGIDIPWTIFFDMSFGQSPSRGHLSSMIRDGMELGIYCYVFHVGARFPSFDELLDQLAAFPDCVYTLLVHPGMINAARGRTIAALKTVMVALELADSGDATGVAADLSGILKGGYIRNTSALTPDKITGYLEKCDKADLPFLILLCDSKLAAHPDTIRETVKQIREKPKIPVVPFDLFSDIHSAGRAMGTRGRILCVSGSDQIFINDPRSGEKKGGISINRQLKEIL